MSAVNTNAEAIISVSTVYKGTILLKRNFFPFSKFVKHWTQNQGYVGSNLHIYINFLFNSIWLWCASVVDCCLFSAPVSDTINLGTSLRHQGVLQREKMGKTIYSCLQLILTGEKIYI